MNRSKAGKDGEKFCAEYYRKNGFIVAAMNYHSVYGEIDVIAENADTLVFCEVKTRRESTFAEAREAVTKSKMRKIMLTALSYLGDRPSEKQIRFDVFEVITDGERLIRFRNNENAFGFDEEILGEY